MPRSPWGNRLTIGPVWAGPSTAVTQGPGGGNEVAEAREGTIRQGAAAGAKPPRRSQPRWRVSGRASARPSNSLYIFVEEMSNLLVQGICKTLPSSPREGVPPPTPPRARAFTPPEGPSGRGLCFIHTDPRRFRCPLFASRDGEGDFQIGQEISPKKRAAHAAISWRATREARKRLPPPMLRLDASPTTRLTYSVQPRYARNF
uniref:Uncharacterized protein n=1 Tax=Sphaerodactylus townsendi TaxID=933632 RepID=A0ACB8E9E2_9SAUR